jgi:hypothetical protein
LRKDRESGLLQKRWRNSAVEALLGDLGGGEIITVSAGDL